MDSPILIAHRGYAKKFPENTLVAIEAALQADACCVEFDVQFTKDFVPVVLHDASLKRTTGVSKRIMSLEHEQLADIRVLEAKKHPAKFGDVGIPTLADAIQLFRQYPGRHAFVEIKQESIDVFGIEKTIKMLASVCEPIINRCTLISYDTLALRCSRAMGFNSIGWIMKKYNAETLEQAAEMTPDFLICNHTKLPKNTVSLWQGPWKWIFYEVDNVKLALQLAKLNVDYLETMAIAEMLKSKQLHSQRCIAN